jgi:hypothetical protein
LSSWKILKDGAELRHRSDEAIQFIKRPDGALVNFEIVSLKVIGMYSSNRRGLENRKFDEYTFRSLLSNDDSEGCSLVGKARFTNEYHYRLRLASQSSFDEGLTSFGSEEMDVVLSCEGGIKDQLDFHLSALGPIPTLYVSVSMRRLFELFQSAQIASSSVGLSLNGKFQNVYASDLRSTLRLKKPNYLVVFPDEMPVLRELDNYNVDRIYFHAEGVDPSIYVHAEFAVSGGQISPTEKSLRETLGLIALVASSIFLGCLVVLKLYELLT